MGSFCHRHYSFSIDLHIGGELHKDSQISADASWCFIMEFALSNHLTYKSISSLIDLIEIHCPKPNKCPSSLYKLKSYFSALLKDPEKFTFCCNCWNSVQSGSKCNSRVCKKANASVCYFVLLPFDDDLKNSYTGKYMY